MSIKKIYSTEDKNQSELTAYQNIDGDLFVCLQSKKYPDLNYRYIVLPPDEAEDLIKDLMEQFNLHGKKEN